VLGPPLKGERSSGPKTSLKRGPGRVSRHPREQYALLKARRAAKMTKRSTTGPGGLFQPAIVSTAAMACTQLGEDEEKKKKKKIERKGKKGQKK
jgi:hypothetical protein